MEHNDKVALDIAAVLVAWLGVFWNAIPTLASLAALIYTVIRIPETELFKKWFKLK